jgi:hypothetical protein
MATPPVGEITMSRAITAVAAQAPSPTNTTNVVRLLAMR